MACWSLADKITLIKNGLGNRPADAVAAGFDFIYRKIILSGRRVLNPAPRHFGRKDEMKMNLFYLFSSSEEVFYFKLLS